MPRRRAASNGRSGTTSDSASGAPWVRQPPQIDAELSVVRDRHDLPPESDWEGLELVGLDLAGVGPDVRLRGCRLRQVRLLAAELDQLEVTDCELYEVDLSGAVVRDASVVRTSFEQCRLTGASIAGARLRHVGLVDCSLAGANLRYVDATSVELSACDLSQADLSGARLVGARLEDCDLTAVELHKADLEGASLLRSRLIDLRGVGALRGARVDETQLVPLARALASELGIRIEPSAMTGGD